MESPYYDPASWGLEIVGVASEPIPYEFNMFCVWTDGRVLYWAWDSGCSCPVPFEGRNNLSSLYCGSTQSCINDLGEWAAVCRENPGEARRSAGNVANLVRSWKPTR